MTIRFLFLFLLLMLGTTKNIQAQLVVTTGGTATALANAIVGSGVTVSNAVLNCPAGAFGTFTATGTNLGMPAGVLLTTGSAAGAVGPNNNAGYGVDNAGANNTSDPVLGTGLYDPCILEFDLVSQCSTLSLKYVFGSEEYMEWVNLSFNDEFGFFVSGPKPTGGTYVNQNIAVIPSTSTPMSIDNVNANVNSIYYTSNTGGTTLQYDGLIQDPSNNAMLATIAVIPCSTYHMKLIIADRGDGIYDSGVFLQQGGFNCPATQLLSVSSSATPSSCSGNTGTATVVVNSGIGPYTYSWSNGQTGVTTISNLGAGTYTITVNDQSSCTAPITQAVTVTSPSNVSGTILAQGNVSCNGGNNGFVTLNPTTGTAPFFFNINGGAFVSNSTFSGLSAGTYTFQIKDQSNCVYTLNATITEPNAITIQNTNLTNVNCNGSANGAATITPTGGSGTYTYSWSNGQTANTATNLAAGTYTAYVFDATTPTCSTTTNVTISQPAAITAVANVLSNVNCFGASNGSALAIGGGGQGTYTYSWVTTPVQTTANATGLAAGTYTVFVSDGAAPTCKTSTTVTITQPTPISIQQNSITNVNCFGGNNGQAVMTASGGSGSYLYSWTTTPSQSTATASNLTAGTYTLFVSDANTLGCGASQSVTITQVPALGANTTVLGNVTCNGGNNGSAMVTPSGGSGSYSYSWITTPAQTTAIATGLSAGTYTVVVSDPNATNCFVSTSATINQPSPIVIAPLTVTNVNCNGGNNGSISSSVSGGSGNYTYSWSNGQTTTAITNLTAGSYTLTVADVINASCTTSQTVNVTQPTALTANITPTAISCNGGSNGSATVIAGGGLGTYTYSWSNGQTTTVATGLSATTYTVFVSDASVPTCQTSSSITITQPAALAIQQNGVTNVNCFGGNNGQAVMTASGGSGTYLYSWTTTPSQNTATASNLTAGTYTLFVTDANDLACSTSQNVTITQVPILGATTTVLGNVTCNGGNNGSAMVTPSGGSGSYTYSWVTTPAQLTATATGLQAGTYTVVVFDPNATNCFASTSATITEPTALQVQPLTITGVTCNGSANGTATPNVAGGSGSYTYSWTNGQTTAGATNLAAGTYTLTIADANDANCTVTQVANISQPAALTASITPTNVTCNGGVNGTASVTAGGGFGGYLYSWTTTPVQNTAVIMNLPIGTYTVYVMDDSIPSCMTSTSVTLTQPNPLAITLNSLTNVSCYGYNNGAIDISASGGSNSYNYSWTTAPVQTTQDANNLPAGTYTAYLTDANDLSCVTSMNFTITQPDSLLITSLTAQNITCFGGNNGQATVVVTGGSGSYVYNWSSVPVQTTATATNLTAGIYTATISDANDLTCQTSVTMLLTQPTQMQLQNLNIANTTCSGGANGFIDVDITGSSGTYTYSWVNSAGTTIVPNPASPDSLYNVGADTYTVYITDTSNPNCGISFPAQIGQPSPLTATISQTTNTTCNGGSNGTATVTASGSSGFYTYSWLTTPVTITATAGGLAAGTYTVYVVDANDANCMASTTATINEPTAISLSVTHTDVTCNGGSNGTANVVATGGSGNYQYTWSSVPVQNTATALALAANTYTIVVNDALDVNCTVSANVTVGQPSPMTVTGTVINNVSCAGGNNGAATAQGGGGSGSYTYSWLLQPNPVFTQAVNNLQAGTYTVYAIDANDINCKVSTNVTITQPNDIIVSTVSINNVLCNGANTGAAEVSAVGGSGAYTYTWNSNPPQYASAASNLFAGTYTINVNDGNCTKTYNLTVNQPPAIIISSTGTNVDCYGNTNGTATVVVSGGTLPYTYSWGTTPPQANLTATGLAAGDYPFYLIDANGCKSFALQTIQQPESLSFTANQTNVRCYGNASGTATIHVQGGTIPYQYAWTGSTLNQNSIDGLLAGNYTVAVTDAHGCTISNNYTITQPFEPIDIVLSADSVTCFGSSDGQGHVVAFGGTPPYTYTWNSSPQQYGTTATGLLGKNYTVTVKDANNCLYNKSVLIPSPLRIKTSVLDKQNAYCNLANGWITTGSLNGFPPYTYSWSPVAGNTASLTNIPEGTYEVFVTDKKGCEDSLTTVITNTPPPVADFTSNPTNLDPTFLNQANFTFTNQSTGQIASYLWNFGDNTTANSYNATHTYNDSGVYVVTLVVFDRNGACPDTARSTYTILPNGEIFTPNVFSPNDDGHNDDFFVSGNGVKTMNCIIYDRWGREIKVLTQLFETWNGKDGKGIDVPEGTYMFKIEATLNDGRVLKRGGSVIVIR